MDDKFRDWIPDNEDTGAITDNGFQDYVPAPEPKPQVVEEPVEKQKPQVQEEKPIVPQLDPEGGSK